VIEVERIQNVDLDYLTYLLSTNTHDEEIFTLQMKLGDVTLEKRYTYVRL